MTMVLKKHWSNFQGAIFVPVFTKTTCPLGLKTYFFLAAECISDNIYQKSLVDTEENIQRAALG